MSDDPHFRIDLGAWARLTRTIIRKGRNIESLDPARGEQLHFESHPFDIPKAHSDARRPMAKSGERESNAKAAQSNPDK
jgi:hypothetical protein